MVKLTAWAFWMFLWFDLSRASIVVAVGGTAAAVAEGRTFHKSKIRWYRKALKKEGKRQSSLVIRTKASKGISIVVVVVTGRSGGRSIIIAMPSSVEVGEDKAKGSNPNSSTIARNWSLTHPLGGWCCCCCWSCWSCCNSSSGVSERRKGEDTVGWVGVGVLGRPAEDGPVTGTTSQVS